MRSLPAALMVVLALGPVHAQPLQSQAAEDPADAVLPARLVVDLAPQLVEGAVREARFDGTADAAAESVEDLLRMVAAMRREDVPASSTFRALALQAVAYADEVVRAVAPVPSDVGALERVRAGCGAWLGNATLAERVRWALDTRPGLLRLAAAAEELEGLAARPPAHVDAQPLRRAAAVLRSAVATGPDIATPECLPQVDVLLLSVVPGEAWPTSQVTATVLTTRPGRVELASDIVHAQLDVQTVGHHRFRVPLDAALGPHRLEARLGNATASAELLVVQAPSRILVSGPARVVVGDAAAYDIVVTSPLAEAVGAGPVLVRGGAAGEAPLAAGRGRFDLDAPAQPGRLALTFAYPGTALVAPSETTLDVEVVAPEALRAAEEAPPPSQAAPLVPPPPSLALLALVVLLGGAAILAFAFRWRRRPAAGRAPSPLAAGARAAPPARVPLATPGSVIAAMVMALRALRLRGVATPDLTVREVAARVRDPALDALVAPFERVRYGGVPTRVAPPLLQRAAERVRQWLGVGP